MRPERPDGEALAVFFRSLAALFQAGVSLPRGLRLLSEQSESEAMRSVAGELARRLDAGSPLSAGMAAHREAFTPLQVRLLQIGERTGQLETVLSRLAVYEEKRRRALLRLRSALTYPAFLMGLCSLALVLLPPYLFQGLFQMIAQASVRPPLLTRLVMGFSDFVRSPAFWVIAGALGLAAFTLGPRLLQQPAVRLRLARVLLALPGLGRIHRQVALTSFARTLALQMEVGDSPLVGLTMAAQGTGNPVLEECIPRAVEGLRDDGLTLVASLARTGFFPRSFLQLLRAGEETAEMAQMMNRVADLYEADLDYALESFAALLEPLVMLGMGVIVGIIVVATMLPMMQLIQNL